MKIDDTPSHWILLTWGLDYGNAQFQAQYDTRPPVAPPVYHGAAPTWRCGDRKPPPLTQKQVISFSLSLSPEWHKGSCSPWCNRDNSSDPFSPQMIWDGNKGLPTTYPTVKMYLLEWCGKPCFTLLLLPYTWSPAAVMMAGPSSTMDLRVNTILRCLNQFTSLRAVDSGCLRTQAQLGSHFQGFCFSPHNHEV